MDVRITILCDMDYRIKISVPFFSQDMKELQEDFITCLSFANSDEPLFVLLDSLDQFGPEDNARQLTWLPTVLPGHVKLVVSTLPDGQYECFPILEVCHFQLIM